MKRLAPLIALVAVLAPHASARSLRSELEGVYKAMSQAFERKDIKGISSNWAPAIRWIPPRKSASSTLVRDRSFLLRDLRVEFATPDRVGQTYTFLHFDTEPQKATVDLLVSTTRTGANPSTRSVAERHHWLKLGGKWWLSRIEALG